MAPPATQIRHDGQKMQGGKFEGEPTYKCKCMIDFKKSYLNYLPIKLYISFMDLILKKIQIETTITYKT